MPSAFLESNEQPDATAPDLEQLMKEAGIPRKRLLMRVLPVVQSQTIGEIQLTLVPIEVYDDAFAEHIRLRSFEERPRDNPLMFMPGLPQINFEASDDTGHKYASFPGGGGGDSEFRFEVTFTPALLQGARILTVIAPEINWMAMGPGQRSKIQPGPWRFEIPLT